MVKKNRDGQPIHILYNELKEQILSTGRQAILQKGLLLDYHIYNFHKVLLALSMKTFLCVERAIFIASIYIC